MSWLFFRRNPAEFADGEIELTRISVPKPDSGLGFGRERVWRISLRGSRKEIGQISYRDGESRCVFYYGHIGYHIDPAWRGHHYALKACRLLREEILRSGKSSVIITCDPENTASRKTCEKLGCLLEGTVSVPRDILEKYDIHHTKRRYIWRLGGGGAEDVRGD